MSKVIFTDNYQLTEAESVVLTAMRVAKKPLTVRQINSRAGFSEIYVRNLVKSLETKGRIARTDSRQPYEYIPTVEDTKAQERVETIKGQLLADKDTPNSPLVNMIRKIPRDKWNSEAKAIFIDVIRALDSIERERIEELEKIETL